MKDKVNIAPFVVGDEVICVEPNETFNMKKGQRFIIRSVKQNKCCGLWVTNVGLPNLRPYTQCICNSIYESDGFLKCSRFRKVQTQRTPFISFEKIKESETKKESQEQEILIPN